MSDKISNNSIDLCKALKKWYKNQENSSWIPDRIALKKSIRIGKKIIIIKIHEDCMKTIAACRKILIVYKKRMIHLTI